ncbi:hypothetical protein LXT13_07400 [Pelomonas sp. P8]|uniref:Type II secretion system (T2SS), protein M subtype b n=2 Tax=Pelomonas cellulosilytica TaxID=2906762 RepID=A0ABS8XRF8_9BURK|nr:hypothetical protein [Pelomonas sp. P8]
MRRRVQPLRWVVARQWRRWLQRRGWFSALAPFVLVWLLMAAAWQQWQAQQVDARRVQLQQLPPTLAPPPPLAADVRAERFEALLPPRADLPQRVQALLDAAQAVGLVAAKADYQAQPDTVAGVVRYRVTMPLRGQGAQVLVFVQQALAADPALALEGLQIKRESAASTDVETTVRWVLFSRLSVMGNP